MLSTYLHGYAAFRQKSGLTPTEQEVVFFAISQQNGCNYCTAALASPSRQRRLSGSM